MAWSVGPMTTELEYLEDEIVLNGCIFLLKKFLGDHYEIPYPDEIIW